MGVHVSVLDAGHANGEALEFTTGQVGNVAINDSLEVEGINEVIVVVALLFAANDLGDCALNWSELS